ncbi:MAG TPA: hypothetical protein VFR59_00630, partial [Steroidobacteraceae bacterium]|nr:hypothetical protein [Steroidobacteraceae bacterium]
MRILSLCLSLLLATLAACTGSAPTQPAADTPAPVDPGAGPSPTGDANSHLVVAEIALQRGDF